MDTNTGELRVIRAANGHVLVVIPATKGSVGLDLARFRAVLDANVATAVRWATVDDDVAAAQEPDPDDDQPLRGRSTIGALRRAGDPARHATALRALRPRREVELPAFAIDRTRVTCAQYAAFVAATGCPSPWRGGRMPEAHAEHPMTGVSYHGASRYAAWVGLALPSEVEWELAGGGGDGRRYPWGDAVLPVLHELRGGSANHRAADAYPELASPYGVLGMLGSSWEWCEDLYCERPDQLDSAWRDVLLGVGPAWRALRGGTRDDLPYALYSRLGADPARGWSSLGFRCVLRDLSAARVEALPRPVRASAAPTALPQADPSVPPLPARPEPPRAAPAVAATPPPLRLDLGPELLRSWKDGLRDLRLARSPILAVTRAHGAPDEPPCVERPFGLQTWLVGSGIAPAEHPRALRGGFAAEELQRARCGACASAEVLVVAFHAGSSMGGDFYYDLEVRCPGCGAYTSVAYADND